MTCQLYRHFDSDGGLLYIGISLAALARLQRHSSMAPWFAEVRRVEIENFPTRRAALAAERLAIETERPKHNVRHSVEAQPHDPEPGNDMRGWAVEPLERGIVARGPNGKTVAVAKVTATPAHARSIRALLSRMGAPEAVWKSLSGYGFGQTCPSG